MAVLDVLLLSLLKTSPRFDYLLSFSVTVFAVGVTVWAAFVQGVGWGAASLALVSLVLAGTTYYARFLWKRERAVARRRHAPAVLLRAPR